MTDVAESYGLGVLTSDLDDDGDIDVFVTNDSNPNFLYRNDGGGFLYGDRKLERCRAER